MAKSQATKAYERAEALVEQLQALYNAVDEVAWEDESDFARIALTHLTMAGNALQSRTSELFRKAQEQE